MFQPIYVQLYEEFKQKIINGDLSMHEKLPSKRMLAEQKGVSIKTVENAYELLVTEGYVTSRNKSGFYVNPLDGYRMVSPKEAQNCRRDFQTKYKETSYKVNLRANKNRPEDFPANVWCRLMRETLLEDRDKLFVTVPFNGILALRTEIAQNLKQFRGMDVSPDQIIIGAGTEYLYGRLIQLLGPECTYAIEDPGSQRIREIYQSNRVAWQAIPVDEQGIQVDKLDKSPCNVLHISPAHHYPLGIVTPVARRVALLKWAGKSPDRYIIEDDYDSEYCIHSRPVPPIHSIDIQEKVIYMNSFSKSVSPAVRISYMILPESLMERFFQTMSFYSCTVPSFEQYTLARFLGKGHLDRYVRRTNQINQRNRQKLIASLTELEQEGQLSIFRDAEGNHILLKLHSLKEDKEMKTLLRAKGILAAFLSEYCVHKRAEYTGVLVVNYAGITEEQIEYFCSTLREVL